GREDTRDAGLVYREGGAVEVVAGAAVEIDQPDLYGQGRVPDGHIAMNRDRLRDAIDSAHELKPRSSGAIPGSIRPVALARPQSTTSVSPCLPRTTLAGLRSRCRTPRLCA